MLSSILLGILRFLGSFLVGWLIGGVIGGFLGGIVGDIECALDELPIPRQLTRWVIIIISGLLVWFFVEDRFWFWILVAWWAFYLHCAHYCDEVTGD